MASSPQTEPRFNVADRYEALFRISESLIRYDSPKALVPVLAEQLHRLLDFNFLAISFYDPDLHQVLPYLMESNGELMVDLPVITSPEETMTWTVYQNQQSIEIPLLDAESRFPKATEVLRKFGVQSFCILPLSTPYRRLGGFSVGWQKAHGYSSEEVRFLRLVAHQTALAIDATLNNEEIRRTQTELRREKDRLRLLLELTNRITSNLELRDLVRVIPSIVRRLMDCHGVEVALPDADGAHLRIWEGGGGHDPPAPGNLQYAMEGTTVGRAFTTRELQLVECVDETDLTPEEQRDAQADGVRSFCCFPLVGRHGSLGVLTLRFAKEHGFNRDDVNFLSDIVKQVVIALENAISYQTIANLKDQLAREKLYLEDEIRHELRFDEVVGTSTALRRTLSQIEAVAATDSTVLLYGETGTGKELFARAIHQHSVRCAKPFVKVDCATIPDGLLESELFGHEKGAFTSAVSRHTGRFQIADQGTIFLDEVGDIPVELQPKLLQVIQEREFQPLGSQRTVRIDTRIIAATNRDLAGMVDDKKFRADLFYRLNVFPIQVPPLRERMEDIPLLVRHFTEQYARRYSKSIDTIPSTSMNGLIHYSWPGNIRELQNVIERAVILSRGSVLEIPLDDVKLRITHVDQKDPETLADAERRHIFEALEQCKWVLSGPKGAAVKLGIKRSTLQFKMRKLGIFRPNR
ncbi:MAG: sigma 54-interacting transcriptional regulator [Acidobacteria bacterium]|nr:sigma 54-interacting transcriptional regulator [Acidobacteriota bacterium]